MRIGKMFLSFFGRYNSVKYFFLEKAPFQFHFGKSYPPVWFAHYRLKCCVVSQKERMAITGSTPLFLSNPGVPMPFNASTYKE